MLNIPCRCGGYAKHRIGNVKHYIGSKVITVKNVPHYYCETCQTSSYGTDVNVTNLLKDAIVNELDVITYN
ncbi:YgiT-type zinc finger domain-containing protein [Gracilibacillus sp. YIM 98692]|uniref:YgiT-type zinc finger domain-containing protein n=1 Tax=Gracilibacillus sp. YIM 98692 TaxID=2663532 RepID=UPI0013D4E4CA|nr:YgiT-type zinc finger domain-containing protein [Gracilibacillus sp. YIM 98692]